MQRSSGGLRRIAARSALEVSPVRTAVVIVTGAAPMVAATSAIPASGTSRFSLMSVASARKGER